MTDAIKICPECKAEFFAHVSTCNQCDVALISPPGVKPSGEEPPEMALLAGALPQAEGKGQGCSPRQGCSPLVSIMSGPCDRLKEFSTELEFIGIENKVLNTGVAGAGAFQAGAFQAGAFQAGACSAGEGYGLFVPESLAGVALKAIEDFQKRIYPELRQAEDALLNGLCPACGADIKNSPGECPDCGLNLSGAGGDGCDDDGCGSCGH